MPLPRRPGADLLRTPTRLRAARAAALEVVDRVRPDVVVGFGGYVSVPAYLAARKRGVPIVVHEGNTIPGIANRLGARMTHHVATSFPDTDLPHAVCTGLPIRRLVSTLDRAALRAEALATFGLRDDLPDAAGHRRLAGRGPHQRRRLRCRRRPRRRRRAGAPRRRSEARARRSPSGERALRRASSTSTGWTSPTPPPTRCCAAPAATPSPRSPASGLPAIYVPLPIGNGEQALNARPVVDAGGGLLVADGALTPGVGRGERARPARPTATRLDAMGAAARGVIPLDADEKLARMILDAAGAGREAS